MLWPIADLHFRKGKRKFGAPIFWILGGFRIFITIVERNFQTIFKSGQKKGKFCPDLAADHIILFARQEKGRATEAENSDWQLLLANTTMISSNFLMLSNKRGIIRMGEQKQGEYFLKAEAIWTLAVLQDAPDSVVTSGL